MTRTEIEDVIGNVSAILIKMTTIEVMVAETEVEVGTRIDIVQERKIGTGNESTETTTVLETGEHFLNLCIASGSLKIILCYLK